MKQLKLDYQNNNIEEIVETIKSSNLTKKLINELSITDEEIKKHYELFNHYIKINESCLNCKGMKDCNHSSKGLKYGIKRDEVEILTDCFTVCDYYKDYYKRQKNLIFTTFNEEDLLDESQKSFILDNANFLGKEFILKVIALQKGQEVNGAFLHLNDSKLRLKLIKSLSYALLLNNKVSIIKFSDFLKIVKSEFKIKDGTDSLQEVINSDVLIIDGIGNESITSWSRDEVLLSILDNRLQMDKTTFICSEYSLEQLKKLYKLGYNDEAKANQIVEKINDLRR